MIVRPFTYDREERTVPGRKSTICIESLVPQLTHAERAEQRRHIADGLYEVFRKYRETE